MKQFVAVGKRIVGERSYESRIDREQSPLKMLIIPIASVLLGSMVTAMPFFPDGPMLPPIGFMLFLGWRLMRPGIWPVWAGLPFGLFDDLFSGQPFGSSALLWSLSILARSLARLVDRRHCHYRDIVGRVSDFRYGA
jgi:cell shape-determining protein MreD